MFSYWFVNPNLLALAVNNAVDNRSILTTLTILSLLILISFRKSVREQPLSILQTNQMKGIAILIIIVQSCSSGSAQSRLFISFSVA
jgi:hypothetical protein